MSRDPLQDVRDQYDVVVIGGGLGGMTAANVLARAGRRVLLAEQHFKLGGLATWFRRGERIFDVSLHGFPVGMIKSCRRYWNAEIADSIVQLKDIRFDNPMFSLSTTFDRVDFTRLLVERFQVPPEKVEEFFDAARNMNFYDDQTLTVGRLFERFFPGREDLVRLLMEPITYANGSTLEDPALSYGIVFSNFMSKGVYTFRDGTDQLIRLMGLELKKNGVDVCLRCPADNIHVDKEKKVEGVTIDGRRINTRAIVSNANLLGTIFNLVGPEHWDEDFLEQARAVRLNNSSTQVYMALKPDAPIERGQCGDLLFSSTAPTFRTESLLSRDITSRTYSFYYPDTRPSLGRCVIVAGTNANYGDWAGLSKEDYLAGKRDLIESALAAIEKYVPDVRDRLDYVEAATPLTFERYTKHLGGASFGTKFEGLAVSRALPEHVAGLYHAGSVGIIMSGWLGAVNYGVIVANDVDAFLMGDEGRGAGGEK
ncbi:MAG: FAD-dependent oxidoreductase [Planctomycetes bacterium]|nr:FAD-dependent oxidoreductase [Planctomycetota bacterium]MBU4399105.1 FAD-dependent oxidoreductase [Planctomycetota bacterium]MCG2683257.1 FAD-dependent oxidoreductase [Planctomycetales bacterium]